MLVMCRWYQLRCSRRPQAIIPLDLLAALPISRKFIVQAKKHYDKIDIDNNGQYI